MKKILILVLVSALGGALTLGAYKLFLEKPEIVIQEKQEQKLEPVKTHFNNVANTMFENSDFTVAAEKTINSVVHVKNTSVTTIRDPFEELFYGRTEGRKYSQVGTGSGVIISSDGYIITNNHVVQNATEIEITFNNKKTYKAKLIGSDEINDIALLKIEADDLPYIIIGNSDNVKVGEWVLAVGNPYNLTSTVTAGIISAKGRDLQGNRSIDSFLQTDAAVNPGNSGGALVNTRGELVGINTAISSRTGSFIGYSFAVPSNIAKKVVEDIMEFGNVQRAILGVQGGELNNNNAEELDVNYTEGFYISSISVNSGAEKAGLKAKDIIIKLDNVKVATFSDLKGFLRSKRPNDKVSVTVIRDNQTKVFDVILSKNELQRIEQLGLELINISKEEAKKLKIENGVKITDLSHKELLSLGVKKGYIITAINDKKMYSIDDVNDMVSKRIKGEVFKIEMLNTKGEKERFLFK